MSVTQIQEEILKLKKETGTTILAHYYQPIEIQEIADHLGDTLGLSRLANKADTDYIIFAGVDFMAETASILNQNKKVLIPNPESSCPMAAYLTADKVKEFRLNNPNLPVVVYVNSTAAVKAESDICCTSSNAVKIVKRISSEFNTKAVLFGPDANLADYAEQKSGIKCIKMPEEGNCYVHSQLTIEDMEKIRIAYPKGKILVHPECIREVRELAEFVGSTTQLYNRVKNSTTSENEFCIGTEKGLMERMAKDFPNKNFHLISEKLLCYNMKKNTIELLRYVLDHLDDPMFEVKVPSEIAKKALIPIKRMLDYS
ncbi:MAG TPA: quinolinate synthase NadA [Candidatus Nanopelagicaceae bacterium]|nr:quinolinate synthase NadA [Candidatus Nanopelagicaceae bacterium]